MSLLTATRRTARRAGNSSTLEVLTRAGLVGYGVLHLAVAWLAVQIASGRRGTEGDQSGAFRILTAQPMGRVLVWAIAVGLVAMAVWQLLEAAVGHEDERPGRRGLERVVSALRTVIYLGLAWTAYRVVNGAPTSNARQQQHATSGVLGWPGGVWWVGLAGVAVVAVGLVVAWYGLSRDFERRLKRGQLSGQTRRVVMLTGQVGYAVKGLAYAIVGVLLVVAAVSYDPGRSTGLDGALRTLAAQPYGELLLLTVAVGFAVYGVFCGFQSRYRKV